jgi:hypothetical protein
LNSLFEGSPNPSYFEVCTSSRDPLGSWGDLGSRGRAGGKRHDTSVIERQRDWAGPFLRMGRWVDIAQGVGPTRALGWTAESGALVVRVGSSDLSARLRVVSNRHRVHSYRSDSIGSRFAAL